MTKAIMDKKEQQMLAQKLVKKTHFNKTEIEILLRYYKDASKVKGKLDRELFKDFITREFNMTDGLMVDSMYRSFDSDKDNNITMEEWVKGLSIFTRGTLAERTKFCFDVYDLNGDGIISRDEIYQLLKDCLVSKQGTDEDPEDSKRELVDMAVKQLNSDKVTLEEFRAAAKEKALLIQCLGPCLPDDKQVKTFQANFFCNNY